MRARGAGAGAALVAAAVALAAAACGGGTSDSGPTVTACNGISPVGLESESTMAGQCPSKPTVLTGTGGPGSQCQSAADCLAVCCSCAGGAHGAVAAMCNNGNCLDANDVCCLYSEGCD